MNQTIERLKRNKPLMVLGVIINIIIAVYIAQYIVGHYLIAHGQEWNTTQLTVNKTVAENLNEQVIQLRDKQESLDAMVNYCFEHVDRPNPIQDLIDKGFASDEYKNITCKDVKTASELNQ